MSAIQWNDTLNIGIPEMDRQHRKWVGMMNELNTAMKDGKGKDVLGHVLTEIVDYTRTHFAAEEVLFDRLGYPQAAAHKQIHAAFVDKVGSLKSDFDKGKVAMSVEVMSSLSDWLQKHIKSVDREYAAVSRQKAA